LFEFNTGGADTTTCQSILTYDDPATWYHITAVREGSGSADQCSLYIHNLSGVLTETARTQDNNYPGSDNVNVDGRWMIGGDKDGNGNFNGWIDDVMHWNDEALTSTEVDVLSLTNYGTGAHQLDVNLDLTDTNGVFVSNIYNGPATAIAFQDPKGQSGTTDSAYAMFNVTMNLPQTVFLPLQRLNFSMAFVPSTSTWEALELDIKIDDLGFTNPYPSYLQIPPPDYPFTSYIKYIKTNEMKLFVNNIGNDGVYFIYSGTSGTCAWMIRWFRPEKQLSRFSGSNVNTICIYIH